MEDNPSQEHQSSISPAATGCSKNIEPTEVAPKLLVSGQPLEIQSSNNCSNVDIVPDPEDAHLLQGDEDVNIADFVQESSSGMPAENSSIDFLPCSTDLQQKLPKVDMAPQPKDAHLPQGDEDVNIADFVVEGSSGSPPEKLSCSTDLQDKLPRVDMALQPSEDTHLPQGNEDVNIADFVQDTSSGMVGMSTVDFLSCSTDVQEKLPKVDLAPQPEDAHLPEYVIIADFVQDGSSGMSTETSSIDFLPCSTELLDKLPKVDMVPQPEDTHLPQGDEDVNIEDFVQDSSSGMSRVRSSIDFLPCSMDVQEKLPKVDMAEDAHIPEDIADFVQDGSSGMSTETSSIDFLPCSTELLDKLPKVDMALKPSEDTHLPQGDEYVNIADFVQDSSSGMSTETSSIDFLPCSTELLDKLPKVDMVPQPEDNHLPQGDEDVNIADFVQDSSSGMFSKKSSIDFLSCSTGVQEKLPKVDKAEDTHLPEDINIADFVQDSSSGMSTETSSIDFLPCSTKLLDKLPMVDMVPQPEDTHLPQGDEDVNIADLVQDSSSGMSSKKSSIDFLSCSTDVQEKLRKVDKAEDGHLPEDINIADFVQESSSGMSTETSSIDFLPCSTELLDKLPMVDMVPQPEDTPLPQGDEDVNIADFVQDSSSGMSSKKSSIDFLSCSTDVQEKFPKVDKAEDAHLPEDINIADFVQDGSSGMSAETSSIDVLPKLRKVDTAPQPEDAHLLQGDEDVNIADSSSGISKETSSIDFLPCSTELQDKLQKVDMAPHDQPEGTLLPQGDEDVNIADFVLDSSSGMSIETSSIGPWSTEPLDKLPKVPQPEDTQGEDDINIAVFVPDNSSGISTKTSSIDFFSCSTELLDKLPKVDMVPQPEDTHLPQGDINFAYFVQDSSSGMSTETSSIGPCSTELLDKLPKVDMEPQPEDTHLPQGDEDVNIADFVQDSSSGMSREKSSIDFLPCSTDAYVQEKLPKVDTAPQPEDAHLPQGDEEVNIADFVQDSSSGMSTETSSSGQCSTELLDKLPKVPQPEDTQGDDDVNIADFVQDSSSGMSTETSSIDFFQSSTKLLDKLPKVDMVPQTEDTHLPQGDEDVNFTDFVQDSTLRMSREKSSINFLPCSTDVQEKLPKVDMAPELTARLVVVNDHSFNAGREQDKIDIPQGDNLNFGSEQLNHPTPRAAKENEKKSNLSESVHGETSPGSVYSSSIFLFLLPCFLLILAILLFFFRNSRKLLGLILWLILSILLCPYKVLRLTWRYFCSLSHRRRHVTGGTKPVSKKHDHSLTHDATAATQHSPDITVLETSGLKGKSSSRSRIEHKENRGIGLLYSAILNACFTRYLPPPPPPRAM